MDPSKRYVKLVETRADGFIEFLFAVGDPELCVEMILPAAAFEDFCATNNVIRLDDEGSTDENWNWSLHDATHQRFR